MGCCNTRTLNDDPKRAEDDIQIDRFSEIENKFSKMPSKKIISKSTTLFLSEIKKVQTIELNEYNGDIETDKNDEMIINGVEDIVEINNEDIVQETLKNEDIVNIKEEAKVVTEESENANRKIKKHRISLTVCPSSPQKLDPDKVFYIEKKNIIEIKPFNSEDAEIARHKFARIGTIDRVLEEKIKNKTNFDDLLNEEIFKKIIN
jgi:hypothetical protein